MTSPSSGYISMISNVSKNDQEKHLCKTVRVPAQHKVVVSFRSVGDKFLEAELYGTTCKRASTRRGSRYRVWNRRFHSKKADAAQLINSAYISIKIYDLHCKNTTCFILYFSFFPKHDSPRKLSRYGWNCSQKHYSSFSQHLACNLVTECEDGRDEAGSCPYSSPQCSGMIALCNRCYTFVETLSGFVGDKTDYNKRATEYCNSKGSQLSFPVCVGNDFCQRITEKVQINPHRLTDLWTGLYMNDRLLPETYMQSIIHEDRRVFHHSVTLFHTEISDIRSCIHTSENLRIRVSSCTREAGAFMSPASGTFCEFSENSTRQTADDSKAVSLKKLKSSPFTKQQSMTKCRDGHFMHTYFLWDTRQNNTCNQEQVPLGTFSSLTSYTHLFGSDHRQTPVNSAFACDGGVRTVSYTQVCDFIMDCQDENDETFCIHPPCYKMFRCANGQCLSIGNVCDYRFHCADQSDEVQCNMQVKEGHLVWYDPEAESSPALIDFDITERTFSVTEMNSSASCPDSHYRCPGDHNDCLPVYTRCNGLYDCLDHNDEQECESFTCLGFFQCRLSKICVHSEHVCDNWIQCPKGDDELLCDLVCPVACACLGLTFFCSQPFSATMFPQLRFLNASGSGMTLYDVRNNALLTAAIFSHCSLTILHKTQLTNLQNLDLSNNDLRYINLSCFLELENLHTLSLSDNPLVVLHTGTSFVHQNGALKTLDLSQLPLAVLDTAALSLFPGLQKLNLTSTSIHTISSPGFQHLSQLTDLYIENSPVKMFPRDLFKGLSNLRFVSTMNYKLCCNVILPYNLDDLVCVAPKDEVSSCRDLLQSWTYRAFLWLMAVLSVTGNVFCCCARLFAKTLTSSSGYSVFVTNLTVADFLMGVYTVIIGVADGQFQGEYLYNDDKWKNSATCQAAGFLSLMSSEVSALIIWFITLDRVIVLHFPFSTMKFDRRSAATTCLFIWLVGCLLAMLPLLPVTSHWQFYSQTGICIPLPITRRDFRGRFYSFSVLIVLNFILFLFISTGQAFIYWTIQVTALKTDSTKVSRDMTIARRLITVAVTDFLCWFPIGLCAMLAVAGVPIPGEVNVALAIFVLPLNSAINPFMYTFNTLREKSRRAAEVKRLKWLESHLDSVVDK